ncbi:hypothetical protein HU675_0038310 [Bradyrhizobium septentrionale]|uniref:hypothetical protein n=1 Tax=Bradyrhizobium septentrionale TaxID=1404411 RepID=UPI0015970389|nr:hypothetical protein [Bradyrhizobium septentrionale]UGY23741.1 hypothetical protein HU675_0038310 [Bradyrhizobium septentrionale]
MALKKLTLGIKKREGGGLRKLDPNAMKKRREAAKALDFVERQTDPIGEIPEELDPEQENEERIARLDLVLNGKVPPSAEPAEGDDAQTSTMKADLKRQGKAYEEQGKTDYYKVIVFADGASAEAFMEKIGYFDKELTYIDGHILAESMGFDLPKPKVRLQKSRPPQKSYERLVTAFSRREDKRRSGSALN